MIEYFAITGIALGSSFLLYQLFLKKEKSFKFNRAYLLGSLVLCFLAPTLEIDLGNMFYRSPEIKFDIATSDFFSEPVVTTQMAQENNFAPLEKKTNRFSQVLVYGYFLISGLFLFRFGKNIFQILNQIKNKHSFSLGGLQAILTEKKESPYSFFHHLFINEKEFREGRFSEAVIQHELAHSKQFHSVDILFIEFVTCFFWFNPFLWLYKKAIVENHEFLADEQVVHAGLDLNSYSMELIQAGNKTRNYQFISGFNFIQTKNRISMLHKKTTSRSIMSLKIGMVLALFSIVLALTSCTKNSTSKPFVVVVDAGHGGQDSGAFTEKKINLQVAKKLALLGNNTNVQIVLIRKKDEFISLSARVKFIEEQNADMLLSLHCNSSRDKTKNGVMAYYAREGISKELSRHYSEILISNYLDGITEDGNISTVGFKILRDVQIPGVMLELGFLSNKKEAQQLKNTVHQQEIAENIYESLVQIKESR